MSGTSSSTSYEVCLIDSGSDGRVIVPLKSFLVFNYWMDQRLAELEHDRYVPRDANGWRRTSPCECPSNDPLA